MADELMPHQIIRTMVAARGGWSDARVLADLASVSPPADEDGSCWDDDQYWNDVAYPCLAAWDVTAARKLKAAIPLILDRASYGDPGEIMRNLCHALEGIVNPDYAELFDPCATAARSPRAGTRLWAMFELMRLRDRRAIPIFEQALNDPAELVRDEARSGLEVLRPG